MKLLISWQANQHDYEYRDGRKSGINQQGTHSELYTHDFDYDAHVLLCSDSATKGNTFFTYLCQHLKQLSQKEVIAEFLDIKNVISVEELLKVKRRLIFKYLKTADSIDIFISPGTPAMQTVWYILGLEFPKLNLFQTRPPKFRADDIYKRHYLSIDASISSALSIREQLNNQPTIPSDIHCSDSILKQYELAGEIASPYPITVLVQGQTGTGKEWIARHIHRASEREGEFIPINCAGLSDELLSSELFGHEKGAFTNAIATRKGAFETAHLGTLFLDEIGDISPKMQQTLLRALQEGKVRRLGSDKERSVDVRLITATNKDLLDMVEQKTFREDLYHRLAVVDIETLALCHLPMGERQEYLHFFIKKWKGKFNRRKPITLNKKVKRLVDLHPFPGNFREMDNLIGRLYALAKGDGIVTEEMLPHRIRFPEGKSYSLKIDDVKHAHYRKVYRMFKGNKTMMSEALGVSESTWKKYVKILDREFETSH